jgi:putative ABC transport system substrate-binding protein
LGSTRPHPDVRPDPFFTGHAQRFTDAATVNRLPAIYSFTPFVEAGGLMCYGQNVYENNRRAADYVDRIFKGAEPGELPIERPTRLELIVNRRAPRRSAWCCRSRSSCARTA